MTQPPNAADLSPAPEVSPEGLPLGPGVDDTPRPLPARVRHRGANVDLEPLHPRHGTDLWRASQEGGAAADASWTYMGYGPFATEEAMRRHIAAAASRHDPMFWAIRPHRTGTADGWLSLMEIHPADAHIELGHIWFPPRLQRTRAGTEAMFLLMRHAMDELGYRRLTWKCNALNAASRAAAARLGFTYEGTLRAVQVVKGRSRDTAWFSMLADEWPARRDAIAAWLDDANWEINRPLAPLAR